MAKYYYDGGKRVTIDGIPIKVPKWYGQLGNDKEFREATRARAFSPAYYEGGLRLMLGGIPTRVVPHVKGWRSKAVLYHGSATYKEQQELERQAAALGLVKRTPAEMVEQERIAA